MRKIIGAILSSVNLVLVLTIIFYFHLVDKQLTIYPIILLTFIVVISFLLGIKYDTKRKMIVTLVKKINDLNIKSTHNEIHLEEFNQFFNSFDHVILYIYDLNNDRTYYSKGVESLFGYTQNQFNNDRELWTKLVNEKDKEILRKSDELLFSGNSIEVDFRVKHPIDGEKWIKKVSKPVRNKDGEMIQVNGQFIDITKQKEIEFQLRQMAYFDDLTDLPNRKMLDRHIKKGLARSKRYHHNFTLMFIDLDDFKQVNDNLGHDAGDMLLKEVTHRLNLSTREEDLIARIGGDEFVIVFEETRQSEIEKIARRIISTVSKPLNINNREVFISVSIGISMYPEHGEDKETLIQNADKAMYHAKNNGKNNYHIFTDELHKVDIAENGIFAKWFNKIRSTLNINN